MRWFNPGGLDNSDSEPPWFMALQMPVHEAADRFYVVDRWRIVCFRFVSEFDCDEEVACRYFIIAG